MRFTFSFITLILFSLSCSAQDFCDDFQNYNNDIAAAITAFNTRPEQAAWQWFICLTQRTEKNEYVWEQLKPTTDVFLDNGEPPSEYAQRPDVPEKVIQQFKTKFGNLNGRIHKLSLAIQVDGFDLKDKKQQPIRYQMLMNQTTFNYILAKKVYNLNGQAALATSGENLTFPLTAWELKLSWLWIGDDYQLKQQLTKDKYIIVPAYYEHDRGFAVGYAALSGMHIINKLLPNWTWSTFEHRYNNAYLGRTVENITGPKRSASEQNAIFQQRFADLENYQLIGVQSDFIDADKNANTHEREDILANAQMESAFQQQSSCIACHQRAAVNKKGAHLSYAIGWEADRLVFPIKKLANDSFPEYSRLDFVWSLRNAQWLRE